LHFSAADQQGKELTMNSDVLKGKWLQLKGEIKAQWGRLTDDDLDIVKGDMEKLIGKVQERYGYERERARQEVDDYFKRHPVVA
jgi:uncharacterized protein YjbJ (UPF0337 family)